MASQVRDNEKEESGVEVSLTTKQSNGREKERRVWNNERERERKKKKKQGRRHKLVRPSNSNNCEFSSDLDLV